jgi:hypothetical protein
MFCEVVSLRISTKLVRRRIGLCLLLPQVAKATIAQIAAILGVMLTLSQTRTARSTGKTGAFSCDSVCCVTRCVTRGS